MNKMKNWNDIAKMVANPKNKDYIYLHGVVYGMDNPRSDLKIESCHQDKTTYHALVYDRILKDSTPLKDLLTNKETKAVIDKLDSSDFTEITEFFLKYNNI